MTRSLTVLKELLGLFVDDGSLAIAILAWVGIVAALVRLAGLSPTIGGALLFVGLGAVLVENIWRATKQNGGA